MPVLVCSCAIGEIYDRSLEVDTFSSLLPPKEPCCLTRYAYLENDIENHLEHDLLYVKVPATVAEKNEQEQ